MRCRGKWARAWRDARLAAEEVADALDPMALRARCFLTGGLLRGKSAVKGVIQVFLVNSSSEKNFCPYFLHIPTSCLCFPDVSFFMGGDFLSHAFSLAVLTDSSPDCALLFTIHNTFLFVGHCLSVCSCSQVKK